VTSAYCPHCGELRADVSRSIKECVKCHKPLPECPGCRSRDVGFINVDLMGCCNCEKEFNPPEELKGKGRTEQQVIWKRFCQKRKYWKQCQEKLSRIKPSEVKRLVSIADELCALPHLFEHPFQPFRDYRLGATTGNQASLEKNYVSDCLEPVVNVLTALRWWETNSGSPKRMPALTIQEIGKLLSPDLLPDQLALPGEYPKGGVPLLDDEQMSWRFEQAQFIKEAITRAIHGPPKLADLIDDYIVHSYQTTPHGKQAAATAAALDKAGIPSPYGMSWSEALADEDLNAKVKSFFSVRYKRRTEPQS